VRLDTSFVRRMFALGNHKRLRILALLAERPRTHREILMNLRSITDAGYHLRLLQRLSIINKDASDPHDVVYSLRPEAIEHVILALEEFLEEVKHE